MGLKPYTAEQRAPMPPDSQEATGPITRKEMGTETTRVSMGTINSLITSGITLFHSFSTLLANHTANTMGITEEPYPAEGQIMGIPRNVSWIAVSIKVPANRVVTTVSPLAMAGNFTSAYRKAAAMAMPVK